MARWITPIQGLLCVSPGRHRQETIAECTDDHRPIEGQPVVHDLPASAFSAGRGTYRVRTTCTTLAQITDQLQVLHQFPQDTPYVIYMSDANGDGTGEAPLLCLCILGLTYFNTDVLQRRIIGHTSHRIGLIIMRDILIFEPYRPIILLQRFGRDQPMWR